MKKTVIGPSANPYLIRYHLFTLFGISFRLHKICRSDPDNRLHDHPWRWAISFILFGHYLEETRYGTSTVRWFNFLTADTFHKLTLKKGPVWTLFIHPAKPCKPWGFFWQQANIAYWTTWNFPHSGWPESSEDIQSSDDPQDSSLP